MRLELTSSVVVRAITALSPILACTLLSLVTFDSAPAAANAPPPAAMLFERRVSLPLAVRCSAFALTCVSAPTEATTSSMAFPRPTSILATIAPIAIVPMAPP